MFISGFVPFDSYTLVSKNVLLQDVFFAWSLDTAWKFSLAYNSDIF